MKSLRQGPRVGGAPVNRSVQWSRFANLKIDRRLTEQISTEHIGWVIELMARFIADVLTRDDNSLQYMGNMTISNNKINSRLEPAKENYGTYGALCYLVTFVDYTQTSVKESVGVLYVHDDEVDVFYPFPVDEQKNRIFIQLIEGVSKLVKKKLNRNDMSFQQDFVQSNVWTVYFILLRLKHSFSSVKKIFLDKTIKETERQEKAFFSYFNIGHLITKCIKKADDRKVEKITGPGGYYELAFKEGAKNRLDITEDIKKTLTDAWSSCSLKADQTKWLNTMIPESTSINTKWPDTYDKQWENFVPVANAKQLTVNFSKD